MNRDWRRYNAGRWKPHLELFLQPGPARYACCTWVNDRNTPSHTVGHGPTPFHAYADWLLAVDSGVRRHPFGRIPVS